MATERSRRARRRRMAAWCALVAVFLVIVVVLRAQHAEDRRQNDRLAATVVRLDAENDLLRRTVARVDAQEQRACQERKEIGERTQRTFLDSINAIIGEVPPDQPHGSIIDALVRLRDSLDERFPPILCP